MKKHLREHRRTLPVVKIEHDPDEDNLPKHVLPVLAAPPKTPEAEKNQDIIMHDETPLTAVPNWLRLNPEPSEGPRIRHSIGLEVPGAVHTITTPSNIYHVFKSK